MSGEKTGRAYGVKKVAAVRPCAGKHASLHETACAGTCGLDALIARCMGVMSRLDATPKPPGSKAAHRRPLRATTLFKTVAFAFFFPLLVPRSGNKREADL
ncbi:hypothetical protein A628_04147 [Salmonella enterica subsp. enterica serovar Cubana str. 76814]|uniref:Uncharacterized protein n=1 Tax=Salmonella enterica subsp. enterica serovar Cubana str. 76814 TaxID=1192560 RepID=V7II57_SALET|nr:hypothetical protein A628_04147 [Salmonella enterica subsp. enterica serovar Cubana str. 76814]